MEKENVGSSSAMDVDQEGGGGGEPTQQEPAARPRPTLGGLLKHLNGLGLAMQVRPHFDTFAKTDKAPADKAAFRDALAETLPAYIFEDAKKQGLLGSLVECAPSPP